MSRYGFIIQIIKGKGKREKVAVCLKVIGAMPYKSGLNYFSNTVLITIMSFMGIVGGMFMKNLHLLKVTISLIAIGILILACVNDNNPSVFVGKWELFRGYAPFFDRAELFKDGTGIVNEGGFSWKVEDKRLVVTHPWFAITYDYKISGGLMTLIADDGSTGTFVNRSNKWSKYNSVEDKEANYDSIDRRIFKKALSLRKEKDYERVMITWDERGVVITIPSDVLFDPVSATINVETAHKILLKLAELFSSEELAGRKFRIEGHTDSTPVDPEGQWVSNWELSCERALSVLHYLIDLGVAEKRMHIAGWGGTAPIITNRTDEGRSYNRRIDIIVLDDRYPRYQP
jgi:flagellar motor protein MotB